MSLEVKRNIKYTSRDFSSLRNRLIEFSKTYFPDTYNDFTPSSLGMMFMEQASYVGDVLNFFLDSQIQENFLSLAQNQDNIYELSYMFGYKPKLTGVAQVELEVFQQLPALSSLSGSVPDYSYSLYIPSNTPVATTSGISFLTQDDVDFSVSSSANPTEVTIYQISSNNQPEYFLLKKKVKAISATINTSTFTFNDPVPYQTVNLSSPNFIKILDATDTQGNIWSEVDYLAQEMVYKKIKNTNINDPNAGSDINDVPYLLKLEKTPYRFATRVKTNNNIQLQFGYGSPDDTSEEITPNPNNVGMGLPYTQDKLTTSYSPQNFLYTNTYGISPSNTSIAVRYLTGGGVTSNVPSNTINILNRRFATYVNQGLESTLANYVLNTLSTNNPEASSGGRDGDTLEEIRQNSLSKFSSQNRAVTQDDYQIRALSMPSEYGAVSKAYISRPQLTDEQVSTIETLNLWVLTKDFQGNLNYPSNILKNNLRTYLSQHRIIGDYIEIRNAFIINIKVNFEIVVLPNYSNNEILLNCIASLKQYFNTDNWQLNQPIFLKDLYIRLDKIAGVQTVKNITITNKAGITQGYSEYAYDVDGATLNQVVYPSLDPSIFEVKYLNQDIVGKVSPL